MYKINGMQKYRPLNLQFFADGGDSGTSDGADNGAGDNSDQSNGNDHSQQNDSKDSKTFTQDDVNRLISKTIAKERSKWEKDFQAKLDEAKTEAEKLAKMNAEQKAEYERKKQEEELKQREAEITRRELRATALETLAEKGMPKELADILNYTDADSTNKSIEAVEKAFRAAVEAGVNERLKGGGAPNKGSGNSSAVPDAETIKNIFNQR